MNWYCIHTRPKKEAQVSEYCQHVLGLETYFPRVRETKTIRRRKHIVINALFPRYLFCQFDRAQSFRMVKYAPDAVDIVHAGGAPVVVPPSLIDDLRSWAGDAVDVISIRPPLRTGDQVEVATGPMQGLPGVIVQASDDKERVTILLSILHSAAQVSIDRAHLRLVV